MATGSTEVEQVASQHKIKVRPPTYDGSYTTFEEWKYKFKAYMGVQHEVYPRFLERAEQAGATQLTQQLIRDAASTPGRSRRMGTTRQQSQVHTSHHHGSCSSNNLQTIPTRMWIRDLQANLQQVFNSIRNKKHWLPNQASQTNI